MLKDRISSNNPNIKANKKIKFSLYITVKESSATKTRGIVVTEDSSINAMKRRIKLDSIINLFV